MHPVAMNAQRGWRESLHALQGSGLVRTVGLCAHKRVALLPQAIELALLNNRHESAVRFERTVE